jgi:hypothetical protein
LRIQIFGLQIQSFDALNQKRKRRAVNRAKFFYQNKASKKPTENSPRLRFVSFQNNSSIFFPKKLDKLP